MGEAIGWLIVGLVQLVTGPIGFWIKHFKSLAARDQELTRASYGVMLIAWAWWLHNNRFYYLRQDWWPEFLSDLLVTIVLVIVALVGGISLVTGAMRSRGFRDMFLISRAVAKVGLGLALYGWQPEAYRLIAKIPYSNYADPYYKSAIEILVMWMVMTGMVKLLLLAIPSPSIRVPFKDDLPNAGFDSGQRLR